MSLLVEKKLDLEGFASYQLKTEELSKEYGNLKTEKEKEIKRLYEVLPPEEELYNLMAQMEHLVASQHLILASINMTDTSPQLKRDEKKMSGLQERDKNLIGEIQASVFILGGRSDYQKFKDFLASLENHIRLIDINSVSFDQKLESYSINFKTYYLRDEN